MGGMALRTAPNIGGGSTARVLKRLTGVHAQEKFIKEVDPAPEPVELPPPQPPPALPAEAGAGDFERRRIRRRSGREATFLTGDLQPRPTKKKKKLG